MTELQYTSPHFKDKQGKVWTVEFDGPTLEKIADPERGLGIDIAADDGTGLAQVCATGSLIVQACWFFCEEQAVKDGITPEQFGKRMARGEVIEGAETALRQALLDFTRPSRRSALTAVLESEKKVQEKSREAVIAQVTDPALLARILEAQKSHMTNQIEAIERAVSQSGSPANDSQPTADAVPKASPTEP